MKKYFYIFIVAAVILIGAAANAGAFLVLSAANDSSVVAYELQDDFQGMNEGNWTSVFQKNEGCVSFDGTSIAFTDDLIGSGYMGERLMSNVYFTRQDAADEIFDMRFYTYINNINNRDVDMGWGVYFGYPEQDAAFNQGNFLRFQTNGGSSFSLYKKGTVVQPSYYGPRSDRHNSTTFSAYFEGYSILEIRLVGNSDRTLDVYIEFSFDGLKISELFCTYSNIDIEGYLGYGANAVAMNKGYTVYFRDLKLSGNALDSGIGSVLNVMLEKNRLSNVIVSKVPIKLAAAVWAKPNLSVYNGYDFIITSGAENASVEGNLLTITGSGKFTLRVVSKYDSSKYDEMEVAPQELELNNVRFGNNFSNITVYTQPFKLTALVDSNMFNQEYLQFTYEVVSGKAEIFAGNYLKINGNGKVVLKMTSVFDDTVSATTEFTVSDPDADEHGCPASSASAILPAAVILSGAVVILFKKRRS